MNDQLARANALRAQPLPLRLTLPYSTGQIVDAIIAGAVGTYLFFYVTAVCGLPAGLAGFALAAGLVIDAILDPFIGSASDSWRSKYGRRLPFMLVGVPLMCAAFILLFLLPVGLSPWVLFAWVTLLSTVLRIGQSLFVLPYAAVAAEVTDDPAGRASLMAWKFGIGTLGAILVPALGGAVFFKGEDGLAQHANYVPFAFTCAALLVLTGLLASWAVYATRDRQHIAVAPSEPFYKRFGSEIGELVGNRSFLALFASAVLFFSGLGVITALTLHMGTFFWGLTSEQVQAAAVAVPVGLLVGVPLAATLLKRLEKRIVIAVGMSLLGLIIALLPILKLAGLLTLQGTALTTLLGASHFFAGMVAALAAIAIGAMLADAADEHEYIYRARREGLFFAAWIFAGKAAVGVGSLASGLLLEGIGFPSGVTKLEQAPDLSQRTIDLLGMFAGPFGGLLLIASAFACFLYKLDARKHAAIMVELRARARAAELQQPQHAGA